MSYRYIDDAVLSIRPAMLSSSAPARACVAVSAPAAPAIGLVLTDSYPLFLRGMEDMFRREPGFRVLATCTDAEKTMIAVRAHRPDVCVIDLRMHGQDGFALAAEVKQIHSDTHVVFMADQLDETEMLEALAVGAKGVVLRHMPPKLLIQCVRKAHGGDTWVEKRSMAKALEKMRRREMATRELSRLLTPRELSVFELVVVGLRTRELAERLSISEGTVKIHLHNIYEKFGVANRLELTLLARDRGFV
jgi:DNA-binding NarL/FixJ family response regulator